MNAWISLIDWSASAVLNPCAEMRNVTEYDLQCTCLYVLGDELYRKPVSEYPAYCWGLFIGRMRLSFDAIDAEAALVQLWYIYFCSLISLLGFSFRVSRDFIISPLCPTKAILGSFMTKLETNTTYPIINWYLCSSVGSVLTWRVSAIYIYAEGGCVEDIVRPDCYRIILDLDEQPYTLV